MNYIKRPRDVGMYVELDRFDFSGIALTGLDGQKYVLEHPSNPEAERIRRDLSDMTLAHSKVEFMAERPNGPAQIRQTGRVDQYIYKNTKGGEVRTKTISPYELTNIMKNMPGVIECMVPSTITLSLPVTLVEIPESEIREARGRRKAVVCY